MKVWIRKIHLLDGTFIEPAKTGVTVIVGTNNSGKTTLLNDVSAGIEHLGAMGQWDIGGRLIAPNGLEPACEGDLLSLKTWLEKHAAFGAGPMGGPELGWWRLGKTFPQLAIDNWSSSWLGLNFWYHYFPAGSATAFESGRSALGAAPQEPLQVLYEKPHLMSRLSDIAMEVFHIPLTLDDESPNFRLCVGTPASPRPNYGEPRQAYREALAQLVPLAHQGHGIRSWMTIILQLIAGTFPIVLADEPEAYLHPPQARALGRHLAALARESDAQVIVATHDRDLLAGLLEDAGSLSVVRLSGTPPRTHAHQLSAERVRELWADPVLRYTNILDGLFYSAVILAEGHRDCTFYQASAEIHDSRARAAQGVGVSSATDLMFAPANGKDSMSKLYEALAAVKVPVVFSPDFDALNPKDATLRNLVAAVGGDWELVRKLQMDALQPLMQAKPRTVGDVQHELSQAITESQNAASALWDAKTAHKFRQIVRTGSSPSQSLKERGVDCVSGGNRRKLDELLDTLQALAIVPVRVGELERFAPECDQDKRVWLKEALQARAYTREAAQSHVDRLLSAVTSIMGSASESG